MVPQFCAYLNAASYISAVLREWGEMKVCGIACAYIAYPHIAVELVMH